MGNLVKTEMGIFFFDLILCLVFYSLLEIFTEISNLKKMFLMMMMMILRGHACFIAMQTESAW